MPADTPAEPVANIKSGDSPPCDCEGLWKPASLPTELNEALTAYAVAAITSSSARPLLEEHAVRVAAARSRLETLYREQQQEIGRLTKELRFAARSALLLDDQFKEVCAEVSSLKEDALTERELELTILAVMDALDANASFREHDPSEFEQIIKKLQRKTEEHFSLGQAWVSRVTNADAADMSVIGGDANPPPSQGCTRPSEGWYCSRIAGHEGPCAARRLSQSRVTKEKQK